MQRLQTLISVNDGVSVTPDMNECFEYREKMVCRKDLVRLEDLKTHHAETAELVKLDTADLQQKDGLVPAADQPPDCCGFQMPSASDEGCCSAANPYVPMTVAPFVLVFNIFGAGVGTMVASYYTPGGCSYKVMCCGIF